MEILMGDKYDLSGLQRIFNEATQRDEPTIVFKLNNGQELMWHTRPRRSLLSVRIDCE